MFRFLRSAYVKRYLRYNSIRRGLLGGSKPWLAVLVLARVGRGIGKITKRGAMPLALTEALKPGQALVISHLAPRRRWWRRRRGG